MSEVMVTTGATRFAKLQLNCHHQQTSIQHFHRPDALPVAQPTVSQHRREKPTTGRRIHKYDKLIMEDESVVPIELYEETVGEFNPHTPNTTRQETVRTLQASPFQDPSLNSEEIPITSAMRSTLRYVNRSSAGGVTNPHSVVVTVLHDLANDDDAHVPFKRVTEVTEGWRHKQRTSKTCSTSVD